MDECRGDTFYLTLQARGESPPMEADFYLRSYCRVRSSIFVQLDEDKISRAGLKGAGAGGGPREDTDDSNPRFIIHIFYLFDGV